MCRKELFNIQNVILPPRLEKGDTIGVFNSSYPITAESPDAAKRAEEFLKAKGYIIKHGKLWGCIDSYRTASAKERADEFNELLYDSSVKCIMASIGGFVTNSMLPYIDYDCFMRNPKIVVGMSDITSLLMALYAKTGVTVYYGPNMVTSYARLEPYSDTALSTFENVVNQRFGYTYKTPDHYSDEVIDWNQNLDTERVLENKMFTLSGGKVIGRLIGGNLNTLTSVWGSEYMPMINEGDILFLENTEEWAGYVERYVSWLKLCGVFDRIGGLIIGKHRAFDDQGTGKKPYDILLEMIGEPKFPILADFDCGHTAPMHTMPIGVKAHLDADKQILKLIYN